MSYRKHSYYIPGMSHWGADWMVVSDGPIVCFGLLVEAPSSGTSATIELPEELANGAYAVMVQAEGRNNIHVDESTKTGTSFDVISGLAFAGETLNIIVIGSRLKSQPEPFE